MLTSNEFNPNFDSLNVKMPQKKYLDDVRKAYYIMAQNINYKGSIIIVRYDSIMPS